MIPLTRYVLVDIDDIFVGSARLTKPDVTALVESQNRLEEHIKGFKYNLGFSGSYFLAGNREEDEGDEELILQRDEFWWFPHMWKHIQPHRSVLGTGPGASKAVLVSVLYSLADIFINSSATAVCFSPMAMAIFSGMQQKI